jgi:group I intron endonuclease
MVLTGIYKIQSISHPNRYYIGSAVNIYYRWVYHVWKLNKNIHHSHKLQNHFNKYGKNDLMFSVIEQFDFVSKDHLLLKEQYYIDTLNPWFNICKIAGSCLGIKRSKQTCDKISKGNSGKIRSVEICLQNSKRLMGKGNPNYGKKQSQETRNKRSKKLLGNKNGIGNKSKLGQKESIETILKRAIKTKKSILQYDLQGNFIKGWDSAVDAQKLLFIGRNSISMCLVGSRKTAGGFIWKYKNKKYETVSC